MAVDTQFSRFKRTIGEAVSSSLTADLATWRRRLAAAAAGVGASATGAWAAMGRTRFAQFIARDLARRIIFVNLLALAILIFGWLILSRQNVWLIDAKRAALVTQSRIIAAAIATETMRQVSSPATTASDYNPDIIVDQAARGFTTPEQALAKLDFEIRPEQVTPALARLLSGTNARARVFGTDGTMIIDSDAFLSSGGLAATSADAANARTVKPKNFWTRFLKWRLASDLPVYQDRDDISGLSYPEVRRTIRDGAVHSMVLMTEAGEQIVAISAPVINAGAVKGVLMLSTQPGEIGEILSSERLRIGLLAVLAALATVIASLLLARTVAGPMRRLSETAEDVTADINASRSLPTFPGRQDEVGQLARSFSNMTSAMRVRIESSERFAADVAHELKNPLTAARTTAEALTYAKNDAQRDTLVEQIRGELIRLDRLISDVSNIQRLDAELALQETTSVDIVGLIDGVVSTFADIAKGRDQGLQMVFDNRTGRSSMELKGHEGRLAQVLTNLIDNAASFSPNGGTVTTTLQERGTDCIITVTDDGPGIDADSLDRIFRRFYTYRPTAVTSRGSNSGLGLSITQEIVQAHGGNIKADNRPDGGARFTITLPKRVKVERGRGQPATHRARGT
ncbi:MAG: stimulus-sensing domain-containing protein [Pseudomonadota bacterium]